jgi:tetratricopeptide (TPR) repeat protein
MRSTAALGNAYFNLGETHKVIEQYQQALEITHQIGERCSKGIWLGLLGEAALDENRLPRGLDS